MMAIAGCCIQYHLRNPENIPLAVKKVISSMQTVSKSIVVDPMLDLWKVLFGTNSEDSITGIEEKIEKIDRYAKLIQSGVAPTTAEGAKSLQQYALELLDRVLTRVKAVDKDEIKEDAFVVWDTTNDTQATLWGGVMTATAKGKKVKAACIDGGIRDTHQILEADFPVFYKYRISNGSLGRCLITHYQVTLSIGGVTIKPGDIILGDIDGVLVVPREIAYDVLLRAEEIKENEKVIFGWVKEGQSIQDITKKGGYF